MSNEAFRRDPSHWLFRLSSDEWIRAGLSELRRAEAALGARNAPAAFAGLRRAAGMALNAVLVAAPTDQWGRTYVEHLAALAEDEAAPEEVREAARRLRDLRPPEGNVIALRTRREDADLVEAARTVMAHAYAIVHGSAKGPSEKDRADDAPS